MATVPETIAWTPFNDFEPKPDHNRLCLVHAKNQYYVTAMYEPDDGQFWDRHGQPVVAPIEWSYRPDRPE